LSMGRRAGAARAAAGLKGRLSARGPRAPCSRVAECGQPKAGCSTGKQAHEGAHGWLHQQDGGASRAHAHAHERPAPHVRPAHASRIARPVLALALGRAPGDKTTAVPSSATGCSSAAASSAPGWEPRCELAAAPGLDARCAWPCGGAAPPSFLWLVAVASRAIFRLRGGGGAARAGAAAVTRGVGAVAGPQRAGMHA
jgi:hypothetical protein